MLTDRWHMGPTAVPVLLSAAPRTREGAELTPEEEILNKERTKTIQRKYEGRKRNAQISSLLEKPVKQEQGKLFACIASRPGQCGRADGYGL